MIKRTRLRKVGRVLHTSIPADLINALGLLDGDEVAWEITGGTATLKFLRQVECRPPVQEMHQEASVDAA
jgi:hypothetical protein